MSYHSLCQAIQRNCDISDARDNGIYSICILILKLRNLYKWEKGLPPWEEPETPVILDWISQREEYWATIRDDPYQGLNFDGKAFLDPFETDELNADLYDERLLYGAGYGRSFKAVFFLAEVLEEKKVLGHRVVILGSEKARELSSPFAMTQNGVIYIRKEALRFFLWDHLQEIRPSARAGLNFALGSYGLLDAAGVPDRKKLVSSFDTIVDEEMPIFIHHEIGELQESPLGGETNREIMRQYPDSLTEFFIRAVKDILSDTNDQGMLAHIISKRREASLGFYQSFLSGIRRLLFPAMSKAFENFLQQRNWETLDRIRREAFEENLAGAEKIRVMFKSLSPEEFQKGIEQDFLAPLGILQQKKSGLD